MIFKCSICEAWREQTSNKSSFFHLINGKLEAHSNNKHFDNLICCGCFGIKRDAYPEEHWSFMPTIPNEIFEDRILEISEIKSFYTKYENSLSYYLKNKIDWMMFVRGRTQTSEVNIQKNSIYYLIDEWKRLDGHCAYCSKILTNIDATIDHKNPKKRNKDYENNENLTWACESCNSTKTFLRDDEFNNLLRDENTVLVPTIIYCQRRYRINNNLCVKHLDKALEEIEIRNKQREFDRTERVIARENYWTIGETVDQIIWTEDKGREILSSGIIRKLNKDIAFVDVNNNIHRIMVATMRETGLDFEEAIKTRILWLPRSYQKNLGINIDSVFSMKKKADYLLSFINK